MKTSGRTRNEEKALEERTRAFREEEPGETVFWDD